MGRPEGSPRNNFNPMFHAQPQPEPPVDDKRVVQNEQRRHPTNGGMVNVQPNQVPMDRPGQPPHMHNVRMVNQPNQVPIDRPGQSPYIVISNGGMVNQPHPVPMVRPVPPPYINNGGMVYQPYGVQMVRPVVPPSNWTTGFCDCFNDVPNAIITFFFPCITFGQIAEVIDEGATSCGTAGSLYVLIFCLFAIPCVYTCTYRTKLRIKYGLPDAPLPDWILHCCCEPCALCQEYRELNNRGIDPAIGWIGNMQRMGQQQVMMTPPMGQRMTG
ncbi:unnamed protein product [Microthlaspi erraticum]|uniref:Uncharacterized protein n=1 Tax=Microthlaspi erraticum TaxID=1685480 RepID=A0A6D2KFX6_9BRAS|nr:unnamed protein product [Microthlaspi erraticum]